MPRLRYQPPKLSRIKSNNAAVVYVNGRTVYMGQWGSEKALQAYSRFLSEWTQSTSKEAVIPKRETTTAVLASAFLKSKKGIVDNSDFGNYRNALKTLRNSEKTRRRHYVQFREKHDIERMLKDNRRMLELFSRPELLRNDNSAGDISSGDISSQKRHSLKSSLKLFKPDLSPEI